jgi:hypothetical protein
MFSAHALPLWAQTASASNREFPTAFASIASVRELSDGRIIVADNKMRVVEVLDFERNASIPLSRYGRTPVEYQLPTTLLALPSDSTLLWDAINARFIVITPAGKTLPSFRPTIAAAVLPNSEPRDYSPAQFNGGPPALRNPRATDSLGRIYFEGSPFILGANGLQSSDSVPIMRYTRSLKWVDTVAWLQLPKGFASVREEVVKGQRTLVMSTAKGTSSGLRDRWTVLPDGRIVIANHRQSRIEIVTPGRGRIIGARIPHSIARPDSADESAGEIHVTLSGQLWIGRAGKVGDSTSVFDVFSPTGQAVGTKSLPFGTRLVGFGTVSLYVARNGPQGEQFLQKIRL